MPLHPTWLDLVGRLLLTLVAGFVIGLNREARGHSAGLRTTILVGLAAAISMIQANMLLSITGKEPGSFAVMDLLRFPLGVLTGVGFIGGGAILRRGDLVTGVTTAATMWIMTMIGLAFGGGQYGLGMIATILTLVTLQADRARFVFSFKVQWKQPDADQPSTDVLAVVGEHCTVERFELIGERSP